MVNDSKKAYFQTNFKSTSTLQASTAYSKKNNKILHKMKYAKPIYNFSNRQISSKMSNSRNSFKQLKTQQ
tara:strand:- start:49 stop:258 length:210 start_codon:yes stop_codon:yes gene_type:complete